MTDKELTWDDLVSPLGAYGTELKFEDLVNAYRRISNYQPPRMVECRCLACDPPRWLGKMGGVPYKPGVPLTDKQWRWLTKREW